MHRQGIGHAKAGTKPDNAPRFFFSTVTRDHCHSRRRMKGKKTSKALALHRLCELFPPMPDPELQELADNIKKRGQRHTIKLLDGKILDGRNRYLACKIAGVTPLTEEFTEKDALAFVIAENLHRRHLNDSQRAMLGAEIAQLEKGEKSNPQTCGTQDEAAKLLKVSTRSIQKARKVQKNAAKPVQKLVREGKVSLNAAEKIATLPKQRQREISRGGAEAINKAAKPRPRGGLAAAVLEEKENTTPAAPHRHAPRGDMDEPLDRPKAPTEDASTLAPVTDSESAIARLETCYKSEKEWFNSVPPKTPRQIVDKLIAFLLK